MSDVPGPTNKLLDFRKYNITLASILVIATLFSMSITAVIWIYQIHETGLINTDDIKNVNLDVKNVKTDIATLHDQQLVDHTMLKDITIGQALIGQSLGVQTPKHGTILRAYQGSRGQVEDNRTIGSQDH